MRDVLRFLFSDSDCARIDPATIATQDAPLAATPADNAIYPQSLQIGFRLNAGETTPPQVRALFPGAISFLPDPSAPGATPEPGDVAEAAYPNWKTKGTLLLSLCKPKDAKGFRDQFGAIEVLPTLVWYQGIVVTKEFLFTTLVNHIPRNDVCQSADLPAVGASNSNWSKHAISGFLKGRYRPKLTIGATAAEDAVTKPMPAVADDGSGNFNLVISCASRGRPQDGPTRDLDAQTTTLNRDEPQHPANGAIPARHVYRLARSHLIGGAAGNSVADKMLASWPQATRYFVVRCTRTWRVEDNASVHFPQQVIRTTEHGTANSLGAQRLPLHGVFYLPQTPANPEPSAPHIDVTIDGGMRWLDGNQTHAWRQKAAMDPVTFDFSQLGGAAGHLQLRLPMSQAILKEQPFDSPAGPLCTYLSMRRSLRALIDNRITGGRLNYGRGTTSRVTRSVIDAAWQAAGVTLRSQTVANNRPPVSPANIGSAARGQLLPIWEVFFPGNAPQVAAGGNGNVVHSLGQVAYEVWQSNPSVFRAQNTRNNYPENVIGRGAAGALVVTGLASDYAVEELMQAGDTSENAYFDRIVGEMLAGLETGAALQFWNLRSDFDNLRARTVTGGINEYGHSPIFREDMNPGPGIRVIDQFGIQNCQAQGPTGNRRLQWAGRNQEIWVAAEWDE